MVLTNYLPSCQVMFLGAAGSSTLFQRQTDIEIASPAAGQGMWMPRTRLIHVCYGFQRGFIHIEVEVMPGLWVAAAAVGIVQVANFGVVGQARSTRAPPRLSPSTNIPTHGWSSVVGTRVSDPTWTPTHSFKASSHLHPHISLCTAQVSKPPHRDGSQSKQTDQAVPPAQIRRPYSKLVES